jgi:hypothetical protein
VPQVNYMELRWGCFVVSLLLNILLLVSVKVGGSS